MSNYPHLFSPIRIGNVEISNRIVHVPTDTSASGIDGEVSERDLYHYSEIAKGGTGLIIVGATTPDSKTGRSTVASLVADSDRYIPGLAKLAESMHRYGAKCAVQLQHPGRQGVLSPKGMMSASDMAANAPWLSGNAVAYEDPKGHAAHTMTTEEVLRMIELFAQAALRIRQAGFDAVELHAAHGYLLADFMSPLINHRTDRFGGSFENRMRFPLAIVDSIKKKCGNGFPVMVRYSADEWVEGGRTIEESKRAAIAFERAGVAALDLSQGRPESVATCFEPMFYTEGWTVFASEAIKPLVDIPVIISHQLRNPEFCEKILADGRTDMVGLSRQIIADPYWPAKAKLGREKEIRRCISCMSGCLVDSMMIMKELKCAINPACGESTFKDLKPAKRPIHIAVVGGGPAGMEAARISAVRGHKVTIFEKTGELGGAILGCCMVPGKDKMKWYADWIRNQINELGVDVKLCAAPEINDLKGYDAVVNATGASSFVPQCLGAEKVVNFESVLACPKVSCEYNPGGRKNLKTGERVLVWGDHYAAVDTASFLASIGKKVTIVTDRKRFGSTLDFVHMLILRKRFRQQEAEALEPKPYKYPVTVLENSTVHEVRDGEAVIQDTRFKRTYLPVDTVISCHVRPNTQLFDALRAQGTAIFNVGDSVSPRNLHAAVFEGASFGLTVDENMLVNPNHAIMNDIPLDVLGQLKG